MNKDFVEIVNAARSGDNMAFEVLYNMTKDSAYFVALSITQNEHDAMDILQESYIKAFSSLNTLNQPENFDSWFNRIVSNKSKDWLKKSKPILFADINIDIPQDWNEEELNKDYIPHEAVDSNETSRLVMEIINNLSEDKRLVVLMYYYQDMSVAEISETLELPVTTVKYKLLAARKEIKSAIEDLEKKGTKLYSVAPLAIIPTVLVIYAMNYHAPAFAAVSAAVMSGAGITAYAYAGNAGGSMAGNNVGAVANTAAKTGFLASTTGKIVIAAVALVVVVGGVAAAVSIGINNSRNIPVLQNSNSEFENNDNSDGTVSQDSTYESSNSEETEYSNQEQSTASYEPEYEFTDFTITLGTYNGEPLVWRCVGEDENGKLMLCESIICYKSFDAASDAYDTSYRENHGSNYWDGSCLKIWLNSAGKVDWTKTAAIPSTENISGENNYENEIGFLSCFTDEELSLVKTVTQKTLLNNHDSDLADGGSSSFDFDANQKTFDVLFANLSRVQEDSKWYQLTTEYFFLLDPEQLQMAYYNVGEEYISLDEPYWLRLPCNTGMSYENVAVVSDNVISFAQAYDSTIGVRPAFYYIGDAEDNQESSTSEESNSNSNSGENILNSIDHYENRVSISSHISGIITENGDLYFLGNGIKTPLKILSNVAKINFVMDFCAAITENGDLYMMGSNSSGQLGNGTTDAQKEPVKIMSDVVSVSLDNGGHSAAITENGDLYMWGADEKNNSKVTSPVKIMSNIAKVYLCNTYAAVINKNGDLYIWNYEDYGFDEVATADLEKLLENVKDFDFGSAHCVALTENGDVYTWGSNIYSQLGNGSSRDRSYPTKILENISDISVGKLSNAAITTNGDLYTWGYNDNGQIGNGTTDNQKEPVKIMSDVARVDVSVNDLMAAITKNGDLYVWGGGYIETEDKSLPGKVMSNVVYVFSASCFVAITENGDVYTWGYNCYGQIGDGTNNDRITPFKLMNLNDTE